MSLIREVILSTIAADGTPHIAPLGLISAGTREWIAAPFYPSTTLENLRSIPEAVANYVDDVRIFAGCLTGRRNWPLLPSAQIRPPRLAGALAHAELTVIAVEEDALRPRFRCRSCFEEMHAPFRGFNRAQAAVIEAAILLSRRHMLPPEKISREIEVLRLQVEKTSSAEEAIAWEWLMAAFQQQ
jgi:hypothetical protein